MRKGINLLKYFVLAMMIVLISPLSVKAQEEALSVNTAIYVQGNVQVMDKADADADIVGNIPDGTAVIVIEEANNGWVKVKYQTIEGYIQVSNVRFEAESGLDAEFDQISNESMLIFESMQLAIAERRQKMIWGTVIAVIIIAMFGVGIASAVLKSKKENGTA